MNLFATIELYGGGPGSGCNPEVGKCGRPRSGASDESTGFFSPNVSEGMTFEGAMKQLGSQEQKEALQRAIDLLNNTFGSGSVRSAIGDWKDGVENSAVLQVESNDRKKLDYVMATLGKEMNQKSVVSFVHDENGNDMMWTMKTKEDVRTVRDTLAHEGVENRTLVPGPEGTTIHVYDPGTGLTEKIAKVAKELDGDVIATAGMGKFIGGDTREEGQTAYDEVIGSYRKTKNIRGQSDRWYQEGYRDGYRWRGTEAEA